jgi:tight adherence protein B
MLALAVVSAAAAALLVVPGPGARSTRLREAENRRWTRSLVVVPAVAVGAVTVAGLSATRTILVTLGAAAVVASARAVARGREARRAAERRRRVTDYCEALLGELRAGQPVLAAVHRSVEVWPETEPVAAAARLGADVPAAYRRLGAQAGAGGLVRLAAAWELCAATGSGLAFAVEQLLDTARTENAVARLVQGELASARATARLVTALPGVVLVAAHGAGARPWQFLLDSYPGLACLATGTALTFTGLWWIDRIAAAAVDGGR